MSEIQFNKAKRHKLKLNMLVTGGSGAGKTVGALLTAKGIIQELNPGIKEEDIWDKILVVDTEHERALFRANMTVGNEEIGEFLHYNFEAPYDPRRLVKVFDAAKEAGVQVAIVDSLAHFWGGEGGLLDIHEQYGGQFKDWQKTNKVQKTLLDLLTDNQDMHVIATSRVKQDIAMENEDGKTVVKKKGLKAEVRDGFEYEFAISVQVDHYSHELIVMKDNSELIKGRDDKKMSPELGKELVRWADQGVDVVKERKEAKQALIQSIGAMHKDSDQVKQHLKNTMFKLKVDTITQMSLTQLEALDEQCKKLLKSS